MKFKTNKQNIINFIKFANSIVDNSISTPYILGLYIEAKDNKLYITSTNGYISSKSIIENNIQIIEEGKILIKSRLFFNILSKLKNEEILFEKVDNSILKIKTNNFDSNINIMDEEQYPLINFNYDNWNEIELSPVIFKAVSNKILQSVSQNREKISILNGVCFNGKENKLEVYGSDSFKLSYLVFKYEGPEFKITIDQNIFGIINEMIDFNQNIKIYISDNNIMFKINNIILSTKIMDGDFPNINGIIRSARENELVVNKKELIDAIDRGMVISSTEKKPIVKFEMNNEEIKISFKSLDQGYSDEKIKIISYKGNDISLSINAMYLLSLLKVYDSENIKLFTSTNDKPMILIDDNEENFIQLILPVRNI